jgi:pimeloyl-ACP methyl ester carboxylesterase
MKQTEIIIPDEFVSGLHVNGLRGRVLKLPAKNKRHAKKNILLVYGHHSSIERMYSLASHMSSYGNVIMPDLPGFGGMDSFYIIGKKPTLDAMADYLATYIKMTYKNSPFAICCMSYGFLVVTKMLQKYPKMQKQVTLLVSLVGFSHKNDFRFTKKTHKALLTLSKIGSTAPVALFSKHVMFTAPIISATYTIMARKHVKMKDADKREQKRRIAFEVYLWKCNDARTYFATSHDFLLVDLTTTTVAHGLHHVNVAEDQYFDTAIVNENLSKIYTPLKVYTAILPNHAPTVISDEDEAARLIPQGLKRILRQTNYSKV